MTVARARLAAIRRVLARDISTVALATIGVGALLQVLLGGRVLLHACTTADGPLAMLGVRLALLQGGADCPDGTLAMGPADPRGAVLVLSLAVPVLAAHVALGACGLGLTAIMVRVAGAAAQVLAGALHRLPSAMASIVPRRPAPAAGPGPAARLRSVRLASPLRRGPPLRLA